MDDLEQEFPSYSGQSGRRGCGWMLAGIFVSMLLSVAIIAWLAEPGFRADPLAQGNAWMARAWALLGDSERAADSAKQAAAMEPGNVEYLIRHCQYGAIAGRVAEVQADCERAVQARPEGLRARDSRGIARMLAGETPGAIADFMFVVDTMHAAGFTGGNVAQRERFIEAMQKGENPVSEEDLASLLRQ